MGEAPPWSAEEADEDLAQDGPAEDIRGIIGGCNIRRTRAAVEAARTKFTAESNKGEGKKARRRGEAAQQSGRPY